MRKKLWQMGQIFRLQVPSLSSGEESCKLISRAFIGISFGYSRGKFIDTANLVVIIKEHLSITRVERL